VDFDDYVLIDIAFNTQSGTLGRAMDYLDGSDRSSSGLNDPGVQEVVQHFEQFGVQYAGAFLSAVPEPGAVTTGSAVIGVAPMLRRRRPRQARA
jgi:hypothetical protein